jgi:outer membrane lipoprotein-sorting protein/anti-anti-sigma regulatory factor
MYHKLTASEPFGIAKEMRAAVDAALTEKSPELTIGLDAITALEVPVMNSLIVALRRLREVGGTTRLHVTRRDLLHSLSDTGLDVVFNVVETLDEPKSSKKVPTLKSGSESRKRSLADGISGVFAAFLVLVGSTIAAFAQAQSTPEQVVANIVNRNPSLSSFQAHVEVRMRTGIPFLNPALEGTTYFKRPDNYEVVFTRVPSYAHGIEKLYSDIGDPASWQKRYAITVTGEQTYNGHRDVALRLVQRVRGMIDHEDVLVDARAWTIDKMTYYYYDGGVITLEQAYRNEGGFSVLSEQHAVIALPHLPRTTGVAHYSNYRLNVAIDDSVFTKQQTKEMGTGK